MLLYKILGSCGDANQVFCVCVCVCVLSLFLLAIKDVYCCLFSTFLVGECVLCLDVCMYVCVRICMTDCCKYCPQYEPFGVCCTRVFLQ